MTPKEKAKELVNKMMQPIDELHKYPMCHDTAKQCAIYAVDEMIKQQQYQAENMLWSCISYWKEVKTEIEKL